MFCKESSCWQIAEQFHWFDFRLPAENELIQQPSRTNVELCEDLVSLWYCDQIKASQHIS